MKMMEQSINPTKSAELFATKMNQSGYCLDFSLKSIVEEIDKILDSEVGVEARRQKRWEDESGLEAYFGETLCRIFNGKWSGEYHQKSVVNFYTSFIMFGAYKFFPSHFIQYRISNGKEEEGTLRNYFEAAEPKIKARKNTMNH